MAYHMRTFNKKAYMKALWLETKTTNKVHIITMYFCRLFLHIDTHLDNYKDFGNGFTCIVYSVYSAASSLCIFKYTLHLHHASSIAFCRSITAHPLRVSVSKSICLLCHAISAEQDTCIAVFTRKAQVEDFCLTYSLVLYSNTEIKKQCKISCFVPMKKGRWTVPEQNQGLCETYM